MECSSCGTLQKVERDDDANVVECVACGSELWRSSGRSMTLSFGCSVAGLLLFFPANFLPFLSTSVLQAKRTSVIASCVSAMTADGWPTLAAVIGFVVIVAPFARFTLLAAVLGSVLYRRRRPWLGRAFRYANWFEVWAMTDVLLLALWIAYARLDATVSTTLGPGGMCFVAVGFISLILSASLDKGTVWRAIMPDDAHIEPPVVACMVCSRVEQTRLLGSDCQRCRARLRLRRPQAVSRATALVLASVILYIPANILPMATLPIKFDLVSYTVMGGVIDLIEVRMIGLALLVFVASFAIPFLKLAGLGWCIASVVRRSRRRLRLKTKLYHVVDAIGRWSMVDPLVLACFVPVTQYNAAMSSRAEAAAPAFTAVVLLTVIAARAFDPRLMWDVARERTDG